MLVGKDSLSIRSDSDRFVIAIVTSVSNQAIAILSGVATDLVTTEGFVNSAV